MIGCGADVKIGLYFSHSVPSRGLNWHSSFVRASFESSVEHFHFDETLEFQILIAAVPLVLSSERIKKIPLLSFNVQCTLPERNNRNICPDWGVFIWTVNSTTSRSGLRKHSAPDARLSTLLLNLSSLYSTKRSPSQLLFRRSSSQPLYHTFSSAADKIGYLWHKSLYPSRLRAQTVAGIIQHGPCNAQVNTSLRPPWLADKLKDSESESPESCRIKHSRAEKNNIALMSLEGRSDGKEASVKPQVSKCDAPHSVSPD